jgi:hypothetical protein
MTDLALTVACPTCHVRAGQPCRSYRAIAIHQARRQALADRPPVKLTMEEVEAGRSPRGGWSADTLAAWGVPWPPPKGWLQRLLKEEDRAGPAKPIVIGTTTGTENMIPEGAEYWPPWEAPPVPGCLAESGITVTGLVWCPVHEEYEELRDGIPAVRAGGWT